jgi:hypothetical protein
MRPDPGMVASSQHRATYCLCSVDTYRLCSVDTRYLYSIDMGKDTREKKKYYARKRNSKPSQPLDPEQPFHGSRGARSRFYQRQRRCQAQDAANAGTTSTTRSDCDPGSSRLLGGGADTAGADGPSNSVRLLFIGIVALQPV